MNKHDKQEIEKLKELKNFVKWHRTLTKEEKEKWKYDRWKWRKPV